MASLCDVWTSIPDGQLTVDHVQNTLKSVQGSDLWVVVACVDRHVDDVAVQRVLLEYGVERTQRALDQAKVAYELPTSPSGDEDISRELRHTGKEGLCVERPLDSLAAHFRVVQEDAQLCRLRDVLLERLDRLNTYVEICKEASVTENGEVEDSADDWEDDPWTEGGESTSTQQVQSVAQLPVSLPSFLLDDLLRTARLLASMQLFSALKILLDRHASQLWPNRFLILSSIPEHSNPSHFRDLLPRIDHSTNCELVPTSRPWRPNPDWCQSSEMIQAVELSGVSLLIPYSPKPCDDKGQPGALSSSEVTRWYMERVDRVISSTGMVDIALATIQHSASLGVPDVQELEEDLNLLSRFLYDSPRGNKGLDEDWTLDRWKSMDPPGVIRAYLEHSTSATVAVDVMSLVMPYLSLLESRASRTEHPNPTLFNHLLYDYILTAPLEMVGAIFEASKPTRPWTDRIIRDDEDMARLALACTYGHSNSDGWAIMSGIYECLPAWDPAKYDDSGRGTAQDTLDALGAFVTPTTTDSRCSPPDLFAFFEPLPLLSLSYILDVLDIHLESGEILSKWGVPVPLRWFLQSRNDVAEQRASATKMARRAGGTEGPLDTVEHWERLLDDMLRLSTTKETGLRGAFGLLSREEVVRVFLSGLLNTGKFSIARTLLSSPKYKFKLALDPDTVEEICLMCSREFYDNASSGSYKVGDMKLAYECLEVPPFSTRLLREKDFIEATSRLSSFNIMSRPGLPISPIEIRLTKDRLSLVSRVLSSNADAYKHTQVILDLVYKLGFRDDEVAEVKTLAMLAESALLAEDFPRAHEINDRMYDKVLKLRSATDANSSDAKIQEAVEFCWVASFQLGRQSEFDDTAKKLTLLGRALELCPPEKLHDILTTWRKVEKEDVDNRKEKLASRRDGVPRPKTPSKATPSLASRIQNMRLASTALAQAPDIASRTFNRVAANFSFSMGNLGRDLTSGDGERSRGESRRTPDSGDVSIQATRALQKGIGWLIGADD